MTLKEKANFARNLSASVEHALSKLDYTEYLGLPVKSIIVPNSKYELLLQWDEQNKLLGLCERSPEYKCATIDFDELTNGQLDDYVSTLMVLFNAEVHYDKDYESNRCDLCGHCFKCCRC